MYEDEQWVPMEEFPHYLISNYGNVKHADRSEARKITTNERGFPVILLSSATSPTRYLRQINKLVALAFLPPPFYPDEITVWHKDGDLSNCHVDNLKWERRDRVLEWNEMHRLRRPRYRTPRVKNNRTGIVYENAFECAMDEGLLESAIVWRVERQATDIYDDRARYRYISE